MNRLSLPPESEGMRLDLALARHAPAHSRSRWQALIEQGLVRVNQARAERSRMPVHGGDVIEWEEPPPAYTDLQPVNLPLNVVYEDPDILVLDKPPGLVVHPSPGHEEKTLVHALLHKIPDLRGIGGELRPGIVHRLDKDTSGLLVVAKTEPALRSLAEQFKSRQVVKEYLALVFGTPEPPRGEIRTLIGRSTSDRKRMSATVASGRCAVTQYETVNSTPAASALKIQILTGRTHQIRVHMNHIGCPIIGDAVYGARKQKSRSLGANRQMLHAARMKFFHPRTLELIDIESDIPEDMRLVMSKLGLATR